MSNIDDLLAKLRAQGITAKPVVRTAKKKATPASASAAPVNYINDKHFDEVRTMLHEVMFSGKLKRNQQQMVAPMYEQYCATNKLSPKQVSFVAGLWCQVKG